MHDLSKQMPPNPPEAIIAVPFTQLQQLRTIVHELSDEWGVVTDRLERSPFTESDAGEVLASAFKVEKRLRGLMNWTFRWVR